VRSQGMVGLEEASPIHIPLMNSILPKRASERASAGKMLNGERSKRMLIQCPDCGSGRRSDGYHRGGWYWLECDRRYNPETDEYSPENNWCRLKQRDAERETMKEDVEALKEMLNELIDCHYGVAVHHIGDGDGLSKEMTEKIKAHWQAHLGRKRE